MKIEGIEENEQQNGQHNFNFDRKLLIIKSPAGLDPDIYSWPLEWPVQFHHIVAQIRSIREDIHDLKPLIDSSLLDIKDDYWTFENLVYLCDTYNDAIESLLEQEKQAGISRLNKKASNEMIKHILDEVYSTVITAPHELNLYKPFTPAVYGETSYDLIFQMIDQIGIQKNDIFIDLGSGVGNVVLQMAASLTCSKCIGVEKEDIPAGFAKDMDKYFRKRMAWYGKSFGDFKLIHGDFLSSEIRAMINESSIIFVNNFAFGAAVDLELNLIFKEMRNDTKIISSNKFCSLNLKMNDRNLEDTGAIMHVAELKPEYSSVSWTDNPVSYFFHVIDSTKLDKYFDKTSTKEFINKAEMIMKHSKCLSTKKGLLLKISKCLSIQKGFLLNISDLKKELEEQLLTNSELKRKNEEDFMKKLEEPLHKPIEQFKQSIEGPTTVAVSSVNPDLLKLLSERREALNYRKTMQVEDQKLKEEIKLLEIQKDEYIKQRTQEIILNSKGHHSSRLNKMNNPFSPVSSSQNDDQLIHETKMFLNVRQIVESQSVNNESEREKIQTSVMVTKTLSQQTKRPIKVRYLKDINGKLRELSPDIVEGHKYYSKMKDGDEKQKKNINRKKIKKEMNKTHQSLVNQNASRKRQQKQQQQLQQQRSAALHRMIIYKTPKNGNHCDLNGQRELVVSVKKLKWTNQLER